MISENTLSVSTYVSDVGYEDEYVPSDVYLDLSNIKNDDPISSYIQFSGPLTEGASIGVTTSIEPTEGNPVQITGAESDTDYYASSAQYFFSDEGYTVQANDAGRYVEVCCTGLTVDYSANGGIGSVPTDSGGYTENDTVTVLGSGDISYDGYHFTGWNTSADGSGIAYQEGDTFTITEDVVLYAQWEAHSYTNGVTFTWSNDYSCTASAVCSVCGESVKSDCGVTDVVTEATCTEDGEIIYMATAAMPDGETFTDTRAVSLPATGHTEVVDVAVEPTCTEPGLSAGSHCSVCGAVLSGQSEIPALGHNYVGTATLEPTCTEAGDMTYTCSRCGDSYTEPVEALGHDWIVTFTWADDYSATCSAVCSRDRVQVDAGLVTVTHETTTEPTCTEAGVETYSAAVTIDGVTYSDTTTAPINALGHDYTDVVTEPTCTERGYTTHTCTRCGDSYVDSYTGAAGHDWDTENVSWDWSEDFSAAALVLTCKNDGSHKNEIVAAVSGVTTVPGCTETGNTVYTATANYEGTEYTDSRTVTLEALGHDYLGEVTTEPTCTEAGEMTCTCSRCGDSYTEPIAALGHDWTYTEETTVDDNGNTVIQICFVCTRCRTEFEENLIAETTSKGIEVVEVQMSWDDVISADDMAALIEEFTNGEIIDIVLDVAAVDAADVSAEDVQMVEEAIAETFDSAEVFYLDIALGMTVTRDGEQVYDFAINETMNPITITVGIPESLQDAEGSTYVVYRIHNGEVEVIATADADAEAITFETDKFSTYAIVKGNSVDEADEGDQQGDNNEHQGGGQQGSDEQQGSNKQQGSDEQQDRDAQQSGNVQDNDEQQGDEGQQVEGSDEQSDENGSASSSDSTDSTGSSTSSAKTADNNTPYLYLLLVLMAGAAIVIVSMRRRTVRK